jgi:hypothetical protein
MREDSPNPCTAMVLIFMELVVALAAGLFVIIAYGYGKRQGQEGSRLLRWRVGTTSRQSHP